VWGGNQPPKQKEAAAGGAGSADLLARNKNITENQLVDVSSKSCDEQQVHALHESQITSQTTSYNSVATIHRSAWPIIDAHEWHEQLLKDLRSVTWSACSSDDT
jgi:hypothetical protein